MTDLGKKNHYLFYHNDKVCIILCVLQLIIIYNYLQKPNEYKIEIEQLSGFPKQNACITTCGRARVTNSARLCGERMLGKGC